MTRTVAAVAALVALTALAPAATAGATESGDYVAGTGDLAISCEAEPELGACVGGQILDARVGAEVTITVEDQATPATGAYYQFLDRNGERIEGAYGGFCTETTVANPLAAETLEVFVDTALAPLDCLGDPTAVATAGTITATWA
jgi:hypothetical protein